MSFDIVPVSYSRAYVECDGDGCNERFEVDHPVAAAPSPVGVLDLARDAGWSAYAHRDAIRRNDYCPSHDPATPDIGPHTHRMYGPAIVADEPDPWMHYDSPVCSCRSCVDDRAAAYAAGGAVDPQPPPVAQGECAHRIYGRPVDRWGGDAS